MQTIDFARIPVGVHVAIDRDGDLITAEYTYGESSDRPDVCRELEDAFRSGTAMMSVGASRAFRVREWEVEMEFGSRVDTFVLEAVDAR